MRIRNRSTCRLWLEPLEAILAPNNLWTPVAEVLPDLFGGPFAPERAESPALVDRSEPGQQPPAAEAALVAGVGTTFAAATERHERQVFATFTANTEGVSLAVVVASGDEDGGPGSTGTNDFVTRISNQDGLVRVRKGLPIVQNQPRGYFTSLVASASHAFPNEVQDIHRLQHGQGGIQLWYGPNVEYVTRLVQATQAGGRFQAMGAAFGKVQLWNQQTQEVIWTPNYSAAAVEVKMDVQTVGERATARWHVMDPLTFDTQPGETIVVSFSPNGAWNWHFPVAQPGYEYTGGAILDGSFFTTYGGWGTIMNWSVTLRNNGSLTVSFYSHPVLGLNDQQITQDIQNRFSFNAAAGDWTFNETNFKGLEGAFSVSTNEVAITSEVLNTAYAVT